MRACIYTRISNDPKLEGLGVARQLEDCEKLADRLGCEVVARFEDDDLSAYNGKKRPSFEAMLTAMKRGEFDGLLVWHTDRLYRSMKDLERLIEIAEKARVEIRTVQGGDLDLSTSSGKMIARILGSVAHQESEHKAERQRRANVQRAEAGGWWSSQRVFGYTQAGKIQQREAKLIRRAAADVLAGKSLKATSREWNSAGISSTRGAEWNATRLKRMLLNPRYCGMRVYKGKVTGPGKWTAILDADTHAGLTAVLRDSSRGDAVSYERKFIGSYRYKCGICGAPLHHTTAKHADGRAFSRYACSKSAHLSRSQPELDNYVEATVLGILRSNPKLATRLAGDRQVDVAGLRERRAALQAQKDELATLFTDGVLDGPSVRRESVKLTTKIVDIDAQLAELARVNPAAQLLADGLEELEARWAALSPDLRGKILDVVCTVTVNPTTKGRYFKPQDIDIKPKRA